jgi:hypothetical protein
LHLTNNIGGGYTNYKDLSTQNIFATTHVTHHPAAQKAHGSLGLAPGQ